MSARNVERTFPAQPDGSRPPHIFAKRTTHYVNYRGEARGSAPSVEGARRCGPGR
jgi:hypothetical protein